MTNSARDPAGNFREYRDTVSQAEFPMLLWPVVYSKDLRFIEVRAGQGGGG